MEIKQTIEEEIKILQNILNYTRQKKSVYEHIQSRFISSKKENIGNILKIKM